MRQLLIMLLLLVVPLAAAEPLAKPVIVLHEQVTLDTAEVALQQVATVQLPEGAEALPVISLGSAPVPGCSRRISADYLRLRLRRYGLRPEQLDLRGEAVLVHRVGGPAPAPARPSAGTSAAEPVAALPPRTIRRHQAVEVHLRCGGVMVHTTGQASSAAAEGELLTVNLAATRRTLTGRVHAGVLIVQIPGSNP